MKKLSTLLASAFVSASMMAQGYFANYNGVMLQGFSGTRTPTHSGQILSHRRKNCRNISTLYGCRTQETATRRGTTWVICRSFITTKTQVSARKASCAP